jgi:YD repeat-containing protein
VNKTLNRTWDSANRLVQAVSGANTYQFAYNGDGNRLSQSVNSVLTKYMLDTQAGLALVLGETTGANTTRYLHGVMGIFGHQDTANNWHYALQDGLRSVRSEVDALGVVEFSRTLDPYGNLVISQGIPAFCDENVYLRKS